MFDASGTPLWLNNDQPDVIEKILTHLGLWPHPTHAPPRAGKWFLYFPRGPHKSILMPDPKSMALHSLDGGTLNNLAVSWIGPQDCSVIDPIVTPHYYIYFTGILITSAPMTSLILKSRLGLSGWALWQPMQAWVTARSG